jgi:hypothetical protein
MSSADKTSIVVTAFVDDMDFDSDSDKEQDDDDGSGGGDDGDEGYNHSRYSVRSGGVRRRQGSRRQGRDRGG